MRYFRRDLQNGFTLLEVLIAMSILAFVVLGVMQSQSSSLRLYGASRNLSIASNLIRSKMAAYEIFMKGRSFGEVPESEEGTFEDVNYPEFAWKMTFSNDPHIDELSAVIKASLMGDGGEEMVKQAVSFAGVNPQQIVDALDDNIKRLEVTVSWNDGFDAGEMTLFQHYIAPNIKGISGLPTEDSQDSGR